MNEKLNELKEKVFRLKDKALEIKDKALEFYSNNEEKVKYALVCVACLFLGYTKGKADSLNKMSDINFNIRLNKDAGKELSS